MLLITFRAKPKENLRGKCIRETPGDEVDRVFRMPMRQPVPLSDIEMTYLILPHVRSIA